MRQAGDRAFTQRPLQEVDEQGDVVFRFALRAIEPSGTPEQALESFYRGQLQDLLRVVGLTFRGKRILVDGFSFLSNTQTVMPLWPAQETAASSKPPSGDSLGDNSGAPLL